MYFPRYTSDSHTVGSISVITFLGGGNQFQITWKTLRKQLFASAGASWIQLISGHSVGYVAPSLESMTKDFGITVHQWTLISTLMPVGGIAGALIGGYLMTWAGRKRSLVISNALALIALITNYFSINPWMLYTSRMTLGISNGIAKVTLPLYISEIAQREIRGTLSGFPVFFEFLGVACVFCFGHFYRWRNLVLVAVVMTLPFFFFVWFIPESPRWYLTRGKMALSRKALVRLRDEDYDTDDEFDEMANQNARSGKVKCKDLRTNLFLKPLFISMGLMFFQQMTGVSLLFFYATQVFDRAKTMISPDTCTAIIGATSLVSVITACIIADITGRKYLLYFSSITTCFCLILLAVYFNYLMHPEDTSHRSWIPLMSMILYVPSYASGYSTMPFLIMSEVLPMKFRDAVATLVTACHYLFIFTVTATFPVAHKTIGTSTYFWIFAVMTVIGLIFVIFFVPETRHKSLEQIERQMRGRRVITSLADTFDD